MNRFLIAAATFTATLCSTAVASPWGFKISCQGQSQLDPNMWFMFDAETSPDNCSIHSTYSIRVGNQVYAHDFKEGANAVSGGDRIEVLESISDDIFTIGIHGKSGLWASFHVTPRNTTQVSYSLDRSVYSVDAYVEGSNPIENPMTEARGFRFDRAAGSECTLIYNWRNPSKRCSDWRSGAVQ